MVQEIWALAQADQDGLRQDSLEAVGEAVQLAHDLKMRAVAVLVGLGVAGLAERLVAQGAEEVRVLDAPELEGFDVARWSSAIAGCAEDAPAIAIVAQSSEGVGVAPRLAARWRAGFAGDVVTVKAADGGKYAVSQSAYDGKIFVVREFDAKRPLVVGFAPGVIGVGPEAKKPAGEIVACDVAESGDAAVEVAGRQKANPREVAIDEAEMVVAGGLGEGGPEGFAELQELADALGAALGGSKPAFDNGWIPRSRFVGQSSGRKLAPRLFVAAGVSGTNYFMGGMKGAQTVVAVNKDKGAPIMKEAALAVVGDVREVVPAITRRLQDGARSGKEA